MMSLKINDPNIQALDDTALLKLTLVVSLILGVPTRLKCNSANIIHSNSTESLLFVTWVGPCYFDNLNLV